MANAVSPLPPPRPNIMPTPPPPRPGPAPRWQAPIEGAARDITKRWNVFLASAADMARAAEMERNQEIAPLPIATPGSGFQPAPQVVWTEQELQQLPSLRQQPAAPSALAWLNAGEEARQTAIDGEIYSAPPAEEPLEDRLRRLQQQAQDLRAELAPRPPFDPKYQGVEPVMPHGVPREQLRQMSIRAYERSVETGATSSHPPVIDPPRGGSPSTAVAQR